MTEVNEDLRAKAALARRLLATADDPMTRAQLKAYAEECERALDGGAPEDTSTDTSAKAES